MSAGGEHRHYKRLPISALKSNHRLTKCIYSPKCGNIKISPYPTTSKEETFVTPENAVIAQFDGGCSK